MLCLVCPNIPLDQTPYPLKMPSNYRLVREKIGESHVQVTLQLES
jgi:hypothetical protein